MGSTDAAISFRRPIFAERGVTDAAGNLQIFFPAGLFAINPVVSISFQGAASTSPVDFRITALNTASVTMSVRTSPATVIALLGLTLLGASVPLAGAVMHVIATSTGSTP